MITGIYNSKQREFFNALSRHNRLSIIRNLFENFDQTLDFFQAFVHFRERELSLAASGALQGKLLKRLKREAEKGIDWGQRLGAEGCRVTLVSCFLFPCSGSTSSNRCFLL